MHGRPLYADLSLAEAAARFSLLQPKYDGHYTEVEIGRGRYVVRSRTGEVKEEGRCSPLVPETVFAAEMLVGTQWAKQHSHYGHFYLFGLLQLGQEDLTGWREDERHAETFRWTNKVYGRGWMLPSLRTRVHTAPTLPSEMAQQIWDEDVLAGVCYEGLVFKDPAGSWHDPIARVKRLVDYDYVILGTVPSDSQRLRGWGIKAFRLGLHNSHGALVEVGRVGSMNDEVRADAFSFPESYEGRVCTVRGRALFSSGALRHPSLLAFRTNKPGEECIFPKTAAS